MRLFPNNIRAISGKEFPKISRANLFSGLDGMLGNKEFMKLVGRVVVLWLGHQLSETTCL